MSHQSIKLTKVCLSFPQKLCFEDFNADIHAGSRIAIIGQNGTGKSSLLKILLGSVEPSNGRLNVPEGIVFGYVSQTIQIYESKNGGERFNKALSNALSKRPDVLILDEPTNHLDVHNRQSLMRHLNKFSGTLIVATHDVELLRTCVDTFWCIQSGKIRLFKGSFDDLQQELNIERSSLQCELDSLEQQKRISHQKRMREQERAKRSRLMGEKHIRERKWPTIVSDEKMRRAVETAGKKNRALNQKREKLIEKLDELRLPEVIKPTFSLSSSKAQAKTILSISNGVVGYDKPILSHINFSMGGMERIALKGKNGSGKTTIVKAILNDSALDMDGSWMIPKTQDIGYLDQHYADLNPNKNALDILYAWAPHLAQAEARKHMNAFLFRKSEEVMALTSTLSGGEKARLSLALIAAKTPRLLILDEVTNNLDLETREHVIQVLRAFPGALLLISHDEDFLKAVGVETFYDVEMWK